MECLVRTGPVPCPSETWPLAVAISQRPRAGAGCHHVAEDNMTHENTQVPLHHEPDHDAHRSHSCSGLPVRRHALAASAALVVALAGCEVGANGTTQPSIHAPVSASAGSMPAQGPIAAGTYNIPSSVWSVADFAVTFPPGWTVHYGHVYSKHEDQPGEVGFYAVVVDQIYTDACRGDGVAQPVGPHVDDLVTALLKQPGPHASGPVDTTLGGRPATRVGFTVPEGLDLRSCRLADAGVLGLQVWYSPPADKYFVLLGDGIASAYILDIDDHRQVILTQHRASTTASDLAELQEILGSIRIGGPST